MQDNLLQLPGNCCRDWWRCSNRFSHCDSTIRRWCRECDITFRLVYGQWDSAIRLGRGQCDITITLHCVQCVSVFRLRSGQCVSSIRPRHQRCSMCHCHTAVTMCWHFNITVCISRHISVSMTMKWCWQHPTGQCHHPYQRRTTDCWLPVIHTTVYSSST